jgi:hypothetical protein
MRLLAVLALVLGLARPAPAAPVFIKNATASTVTQVLRPWTQTQACSCCVCWETAMSTVLSFWDSQTYASAGPWKLLLPGGDGFDAAAFKKTSEAIYGLSGVACRDGINMGMILLNECGPEADVAKKYVNDQLGYSFAFDEDSWVWWGNDIQSPINAGRPIYYAYYPETTSAHAVTIVGYDDSDQSVFIYKTWQPVVTQKGFDEPLNQCTVDITPGGSAPAPAGWSCAASKYASNDGCDCACGAPDPDCEDPAAVVKGCGSGQSCSPQGTCVTGCTDECAAGAKECASDSQIRTCGQFDSDSCREWGAGQTCAAGTICKDGACEACPDGCTLGTSRCQGTSQMQLCTKTGTGCTTWTAPVACPSGTQCSGTACGYPGGGDRGGSLEPDAGESPGPMPPESSGGCTLAPRARASASILLLLPLALLALRRASRQRRR